MKTNILKKSICCISSFILFILVIRILQCQNLSFFINLKKLPSLKSIIIYALNEFNDKIFWENIVISVSRVLSGFFISASSAIVFAIMASQMELIKNSIYPLLELLRPIPNAAWVPISILIFSSINASMIFIIIVSSFFPIMLNSLKGLESVHENYKKTAKFLGVNKISYLFEILIPAALPDIFIGLSLGMSGAWLGLVMTEMISGQSGIGYMIWVNYTLIDFSGVVFGMIVIGILGALSCQLLSLISKFLLPWNRSFDK